MEVDPQPQQSLLGRWLRSKKAAGYKPDLVSGLHALCAAHCLPCCCLHRPPVLRCCVSWAEIPQGAHLHSPFPHSPFLQLHLPNFFLGGQPLILTPCPPGAREPPHPPTAHTSPFSTPHSPHPTLHTVHPLHTHTHRPSPPPQIRGTLLRGEAVVDTCHGNWLHSLEWDKGVNKVRGGTGGRSWVA